MGAPAAKSGVGQNALDGLVGKPVTEFLSRLCSVQNDLAALRFAAYTPEPKLSERLNNTLTQEESELRDKATAVCHDNGIPFWDALLGICMGRDSIPERFLQSAGLHGSSPPIFQCDVSSSEVSTARIEEIINRLPNGLGLVVSSKVTLRSGEIGHIPMLDFRCPCTPGNAKGIREILKLLGETAGVIVGSGRSFHYYGARLLSDSSWSEFMAHALLFAPVVDPRYIAHRLKDGECRLKLVASKESTLTKIVDAYTD